MSEILVKCPICGDHRDHPHLYLNPEKKVYHCWYCDASGKLEWLLEKYPHLVTATLISELKPERREYQPAFTPLEKTENERRRKEALAFLRKRGVTEKMAREVRVSLSHGDQRVEHYVVFPDLPGGPDVFWAARAIGLEKPKWLFPSKGVTHLSAHRAVWGLAEYARSGEKDLWLCEGIFDALAVNGVACFGKTPSNEQLRKIVQALGPDGRVVVAFDRDAQNEAWGLQKRLRTLVRACVAIPALKDYGEYLEEGWQRRRGESEPGPVPEDERSFK